MAGNIELKYGTNNQSLTITITSLANAAARASTAIDNTTTVYEDILVQLTIKTGAASVSATGIINVYAVGTVDGGTTYGEGATGTDAAITLTVPTNAILIGTINAVSNATTYKSSALSVARAFNGVLPDHVVIIVDNKTGAAFDATTASAKFQGVQHQYT